MINLTIKDIQHLESVITTVKAHNNTELNLYCSQSFYDLLLKQLQAPKLEQVSFIGSSIEVYIKPQIPNNCALLQGTEDTYLLKYV